MNETLGQAVLQAIQQRLGNRNLVCGLCGGTRWQAVGVANISVQDNLSAGMVIGGKALPLIGMTCDVCGFTQFHNLLKLLGKEKVDEIIEQQKLVQEAENIVKEKGGKHE